MASHTATSDTLTVATGRHREPCRLVGTAHIARDDDELVVLLLVSLVTGRSRRLVIARPRRADAGMVHGCHRNDTPVGLASAS
jgi:hypothetical protein